MAGSDDGKFFVSDRSYFHICLHFLHCSYEGKFFIWDRRSGNIVRVLVGDESIVNCLQVMSELKNIEDKKDMHFQGHPKKYKYKTFISRAILIPPFLPHLALTLL